MNQEDLSSEFEFGSSESDRKRNYRDLAQKEPPAKIPKPTKDQLGTDFDRESGRENRQFLKSLDAYSLHKRLINEYVLTKPDGFNVFQRDKSKDRTDLDVVREHHRFLWEEEPASWEQRLAKRYFDKLFKEYCIVDLSRYKENKIAMRWRIEKEVVEGKGQFICANKRCLAKELLKSWEVNFAYMEGCEKKNALVKTRLCPECSYKLNYHQKKKLVDKKKWKRNYEQAIRQHGEQANLEPNTVGGSAVDEEPQVSAELTEEEQTEHWSKPGEAVEEEKAREEEFEEFLEDLLL